MKRTPKSNTDEQQLRNSNNWRYWRKKGLIGGIEFLKLVKMSSHSDIENMDK